MYNNVSIGNRTVSRAASASAISAELFEKLTSAYFLILKTWKKNCVEEVLEDLSSSLFSPFDNTSLQSFFVIILRDIIGLEKFLLSFSQS